MTHENNLQIHRDAMDANNFAHIRGYSRMISGAGAREADFNAHWDELVLDENYKSYTTRHRRILRYWYTHPGEMTLNRNTVYQPKVTYDVEYTQGANHLTYATAGFIADPLLQNILRLDLELLAPKLKQGQAYSVDVDLFKVSSDSGKISPTTSGRHQDGEDFLCMHFIGAENVVPVVSEVLPADPQAPPLFKQAMTQFLETLVVDDRALFHAASPVEQKCKTEPAHRNLLLVSISALSEA